MRLLLLLLLFLLLLLLLLLFDDDWKVGDAIGDSGPVVLRGLLRPASASNSGFSKGLIEGGGAGGELKSAVRSRSAF